MRVVTTAALLPLLSAAGCALTTPAPGGPLRAGTFTQLQPSWAIAYGRETATVDGERISSNGQTQNFGRPKVDPLPNPVPLTMGVRQELGSGLEANADLGWVDSGVGLRVGLPFAGDDVARPVVLSAGVRTGMVSLFGNESYDARVTLEAYPDISRAKDGSLRLQLSIGVDAGVFAHQLLLPEIYDSSSYALSGTPIVNLLRREIRLQTAVGFYLTTPRGHGLSIALAPWVLLNSDDPLSVVCSDCGRTPKISDFSQTWGVSLIVAPAFGWAHER